ncbi:hypothetical protein BABINDRAFT_168986 [Babjeviella inositovora NRRL Y-12698]|uniref:Uncharacterized protein n=1 Tax=Babjeviella inositovora NRRL Y-12698 TaxID=984486 RepID=A0A1E3QKQ6_9ASCO|nr:uncharacterized protein BABINDRAFT_168986 [Babjeviella inositovora NRRL Y-12698]ODQ77672.1 hypothetical protein BABINDRAFT_168986 [Babjeviella inositovora NRRL Y-12698]
MAYLTNLSNLLCFLVFGTLMYLCTGTLELEAREATGPAINPSWMPPRSYYMITLLSSVTTALAGAATYITPWVEKLVSSSHKSNTSSITRVYGNYENVHYKVTFIGEDCDQINYNLIPDQQMKRTSYSFKKA